MSLELIREDLEKLLQSNNPYSLAYEEKCRKYQTYMTLLGAHHREKCAPYDKMMQVLPKIDALQPPLPVALFKNHLFASVPEEEIYTIMQSSGTTGQTPSSVCLDAKTAMLQQRVLHAIGADFLGPKRLPMLIIDSRSVLKDRRTYSARAAGIMGFAMFASDKCFALDDQMKLDLEAVQAFLEKHAGKPIFVFGFTFMVWQNLYEALKEKGVALDLTRGILVHGGGWKKLSDRAVTETDFAAGLYETCHLTKIHNYYGMAEQTGSIFMGCEAGHLHASDYSDIIFRNLQDFSACKIGEEGVAEVCTPLAMSYPGHDLLTEDMGILLGIDDCPCGRKGKYFKLTGRMKRAQIRGCSDVYAD